MGTLLTLTTAALRIQWIVFYIVSALETRLSSSIQATSSRLAPVSWVCGLQAYTTIPGLLYFLIIMTTLLSLFLILGKEAQS